MTKCESRYWVDAGLTLECIRKTDGLHAGHRDHYAYYMGLRFYWKTAEEDSI